MNSPRMRLKRFLSHIPFAADLLSRHDQIVLQKALQRERFYVQSTPAALENFERRFFSQNGEDGIIQEIFRRIGTTDRHFVEFGIESGAENCTRALLEQDGWHGLWIEGDSASVERAQDRFASLPVQIMNAFLTRDNILDSFAQAEVPAQFDLLVIDVDGNDYWLWQTLSAQYRPRLLVIEYNAAFTPDEYWVMPYNPAHRWQEDGYFGASLKAYAQLAHQSGYELVACDSSGVNAFFVRRDLLNDQFRDVGSLPLLHRTYKHNALWYGPAPSSHIDFAHFRTQPIPPSEITRLRLTWAQPADRLQFKVGGVSYLQLELHNQSATVLKTAPPYPVSLSYHWIDSHGSVVEGVRTPLLPTSQPASQNRYWVRVYAPSKPGQYTLRLALLQELLLWFFEANPACALTLPVEVLDEHP